ncbi:MAG: ABC transporter substrate-binding protein, partial [Anaerolineae bacterium]|nr:ABC transporter substrate-binding protein [Anaerolineae bacterium]
MRKTVLSVFTLIVLLAACSGAPIAVPTETPIVTQTPTAAALIPMTFMAGYKPQANLPFVGVYVAKAKGFFAQNGLDVTIEHASGKGEHVQLLVAGTVQVTTMDAATVLQRRADPGLPVVAIALIGQKGQQ